MVIFPFLVLQYTQRLPCLFRMAVQSSGLKVGRCPDVLRSWCLDIVRTRHLYEPRHSAEQVFWLSVGSLIRLLHITHFVLMYLE